MGLGFVMQLLVGLYSGSTYRMALLKLIVLSLLISCSSMIEKSAIDISYNKDTISYGEVIVVELAVPFNDSILPSFYINYNNEIFPLPFYEDKNKAIIEFVGRSKGRKSHGGYVEYLNEKGVKIKEEFIIEYFVNDTIVD